MTQVKDIIIRIMYSTPKELGPFLREVNRRAFSENEWDVISVKASYSEIVDMIGNWSAHCRQELESGEDMSGELDESGVMRWFSLRQALTNLGIAQEFFSNPPVVEDPNVGGLKVNVDDFDWTKPVYTADEVKALCKISDTTFRRWLNDGWISYSQVPGSDKKYIQREHLLAFLNNQKIFYPSSK